MLDQNLIYTIEFRNIVVEISIPNNFYEVSVKTIISHDFPVVDFQKSLAVLEKSENVYWKWKRFIKNILQDPSAYKVLKTKRLRPITIKDMMYYFDIDVCDDIFVGTDAFENYLKIVDLDFLKGGV